MGASKELTSARTETQTRILAAALEVFAERGFSAATTAEIARRARVAEKTLFAHFKNKESLFEQTLTPATLQLLVPEAVASLPAILEGEWPRLEDFLVALFQNRLTVFKRHPVEFKLIIQEFLLRPERLQPFRALFASRIQPHAEAIFERMRRKGEIGDLRFDVLIRMCVSTIFGYAIDRFVLRPELEWDDEKEIREMARLLANGLKAQSKPSARPRRTEEKKRSPRTR